MHPDDIERIIAQHEHDVQRMREIVWTLVAFAVVTVILVAIYVYATRDIQPDHAEQLKLIRKYNVPKTPIAHIGG